VNFYQTTQRHIPEVTTTRTSNPSTFFSNLYVITFLYRVKERTPYVQGTVVSALPTYLSIHQYVRLSLCSPSGPWLLFQFLNPYAVSRTALKGDQLIPRPLAGLRTTPTQNKRTQTSMPRLGFEPRIRVFEQAKTVHALDRAATLIGCV
jgi:hypothetical protein